MRSTVSAVKIHALSAVTKMYALVFNTYFRFGCLCGYGSLVVPITKFLKVVLTLGLKPDPAPCSKTEE